MDLHDVLATITQLDDAAIADYINKLADLYRNGEDLRELKPLLEHPDSRVVWIGAWIVSEVAERTRGREVYSQLSKLLSHPDPFVRFAVIASVAFLIKPTESDVVTKLLLLAADENAGVRQQALFYLCLIPDSIIAPVVNTYTCPSAHLLLSTVTKDDIRSGLASAELLTQRLAVAGALRNYGDTDNSLLDTIVALGDEVANALPRLPRNKVVT